MGSLWSRNSPSTHPGLRTIAALWRLRKVRIDVRRLRHATLIHVALLGELARRLVPPHRSSLTLLAHEIRLLAKKLAHELGVLGFVVAAGQHHGRFLQESKCEEAHLIIARAEPATKRYSYSRHSSAPLKSGVLRLALRPINLGSRVSPLRIYAVQPAKRCFRASPSRG